MRLLQGKVTTVGGGGEVVEGVKNLFHWQQQMRRLQGKVTTVGDGERG